MISLCGHEPSQNIKYLGSGKFTIFTPLKDLYHKSVILLQVYNVIQSFTKIEVNTNTTVYVSIYSNALALRLIALRYKGTTVQYSVLYNRW